MGTLNVAGVSATRVHLAALSCLAEEVESPVLLMNLNMVRRRFQDLSSELPDYHLRYAVKANSERRVVEALRELGAGFEVSSREELALLLSLGVSPHHIVSGNPAKDPSFVRMAWEAGMHHFVFDSKEEADKLAALAPGSQVLVRLAVSNEGSEWPLSRKFGVDGPLAVDLLRYARQRGLHACGIAFHVGSQSVQPVAQVRALEAAREVWGAAVAEGMEMSVLNIGGGYPVPYTKPVPPFREFATAIREAIHRLFPSDTTVIAEPGRFLVGEAGILATTVIAKAWRNDERWLYLDVGVFNGLMEALGGIRYPVATTKQGEASPWVLAGPSCDSMDVIDPQVMLPEPAIGDRLFILSAGAYTTVYASNFNGFPAPTIHVVETDEWL